MSREIIQEINIKTSPDKIYGALTDADLFSQFTGTKAAIDMTPGGKISLFDGMISGITVESVENKSLVQVWRAGNWAEGIYSLVKFDIDGNESNSRIKFEHTGFPAEAKGHLEAGWHKMYWDPLIKYLG